MKNKILEFLYKKQDYVSGEDISRRMGISRQALWKYMHELRDLGYDITAVPHLGYRLVSSPDRLFPFEISVGLKTRILAKKIFYYETLPSTMDVAMELGLKGVPEGTIVLTESQTKGKGRLGREWHSPKYKGIYVSLVLRPDILPRETSVLTLVAAVGVCEAIKEVTGVSPQIKWPNDILINNRKLGGILTELNAEMDKVFFAVIGIGINVNNDNRSLCDGAVSLKEHIGERQNRTRILRQVLFSIEENYLSFKRQGSLLIMDKWRLFSSTLGRRVRVVCRKAGVKETDRAGRLFLEGEAVDIDIDGGLLIRLDTGILEKVTSGDVEYCR